RIAHRATDCKCIWGLRAQLAVRPTRQHEHHEQHTRTETAGTSPQSRYRYGFHASPHSIPCLAPAAKMGGGKNADVSRNYPRVMFPSPRANERSCRVELIVVKCLRTNP